MTTTKSVLLWSLLVGLITSGCAGQRSQQRFHYTASVPAVTVHIIGDATQFPPHPYDSKRLVGLAKENEVWVLGKQTPEGNIIVDETLLGHEITHVLATHITIVKNPDRIHTREKALHPIYYTPYETDVQRTVSQRDTVALKDLWAKSSLQSVHFD